MTERYQFDEIGRLPLPGDNVAIATRRLDAGTLVTHGNQLFTLNHSILEGHRFAVAPIAEGKDLLSWELPFGVATQDIEPGNYVCNYSTLKALKGRSIAGKLSLPLAPNFVDRIVPYAVDEKSFEPAQQLPFYDEVRTFMGYRRSERRGVGTRNDIVLLGTTSQTGSYVRLLADRLNGQNITADYTNIDDIVAAAHTEGAVADPNNLEITLRTLAGYITHPNVGAILIVDYGTEPLNNAMLQAYLEKHKYPLDQVPHQFISLAGAFQENLAQGEAIVQGWLEEVNSTPRTEQSLGHLKIALQCGGSDAFSGISGNPLAAWVAREVIRSGGSANLAETDELIGAEPYVLQKVRDIETAQKFLATIERFKKWTANHGASAEGNPSGGNKYRGLYNIVLKSIGAAMKRNPDVRLDGVLEYSEVIEEPGYYFMDSPGNDLESIAGQVASGCNMIFFVTGNGSITNFPFVPTIKIVTTSARYNLLSKDMDVNAGAYQDGTSMDDLGQEMLGLMIDIASGQRSVGEKAGHAQLQLWRDWQQTNNRNLKNLQQGFHAEGQAITIQPVVSNGNKPFEFPAFAVKGQRVTDQIGLILPTSLCSAQIARMAAKRLNENQHLGEGTLSRFVTLTHTEGCGSSPEAHQMYIQTLLGYLTHPLVKHCLLVEHGCEATHNDYIREHIAAMAIAPDQYGWASIQLDGGIEAVLDKIDGWFDDRLKRSRPREEAQAGLGDLRVGLLSDSAVNEKAAQELATLTRQIVGAGGTVVVPENSILLSQPSYQGGTYGTEVPQPSLAYAQRLAFADDPSGFHIMQTPTEHWVETIVGLGATGVELVIAHVGEHPMQGHPMLPMLQVSAEERVIENFGPDIDVALDGERGYNAILERIAETVSNSYTPTVVEQGNIDFQVTRGMLGISL